MIPSFPRRFSALVLTGALASLAVVACSATTDDGSDALDDQLRITPKGNETMSTLILQLPTGSCLPGNACARPLAKQPTFTLDNTTMSLGKGLRVLPGDHTLKIGDTSAKITLAAGKTRTLVVPVVKEVCTDGAAAALPDTEFGRQPTLHFAACPSPSTIDGQAIAWGNANDVLYAWAGDACNGTYIWAGLSKAANCNSYGANAYTVGSVQINGVCYDVPNREWHSECQLWTTQGAAGIGAPGTTTLGVDTAVVPGDYGFKLETAAGPKDETRTIAEGDLKDISFTLDQIGTIPNRFATRLHFKDARELADAVAPTITSNCERNYTVPHTAAGDVTLHAFQFAECNYQLNASGRTVALTQTADNDVNLHRVDVDDVEVTREDGTTYTTPGTYELYYGGQKVAGPYKTNTGIDVLDGDYELVVKYSTAEGQKSNHYNVNF